MTKPCATCAPYNDPGYIENAHQRIRCFACNPHPELTPAQLQALKAYAAYAGRTWKDELRRAWMSASLPGHLHSLRNSHGPSWLNQFQFPKEGN